MINYDNQRDLSMQFCETRRCYDQSEYICQYISVVAVYETNH